MGHQMSERQRELVKLTVENADPCPQDIDDCLDLLEKEKILTMKKAKTFWLEFLQVCQQAMDARNARDVRDVRDARPPSPPTSGISPPSSADPVPGTLYADRADGALLAAAHDSRKKKHVSVHLATSDSFKYARAIFTNTEFSYIRERIVKDLELQCEDGIVQIRWKDPYLATDADHAALATVLILVSEEEASRVEMKVDILFGDHCREERHAQLQAVCTFMGIQSASLPTEVQPDDSCAGSVAEAVSLPKQALESIPSQSSCGFVIMGPDVGRQAANFVLQYEAAHRSAAFRREAQVPA